ncbi:MAG: PQQ-binding-like beta-propeller repeat protein [Polyangiaceae bacterium]|nr:PQQ-binding-like beta-propeller repeat protein [Myxococcales bacterium]MCB9588036.1 PQQ-binding-like beta-propeller repeat protein [Polyangiaceae bacterium]
MSPRIKQLSKFSSLVCGAALLAACSGSNALSGAFDTTWQNDGGQSISSVQRELASASIPKGTGLAVGVVKGGLVATTLAGKSWKYTGSVDARPKLSGDVVVATGDNQLFALDARTGQKLWSISSGGRSLRGAGDDGTYTVASLGALNGGQSRLVVVKRGGSVILDAEPEPEIGTPAIVGGIAFVPWGNQYVSAIDVTTGAERGRLLMRQQVTHAENVGGELYFGESQLLRFDPKIGAAAGGGGTLAALPKHELPGTPRWFAPGAEVLSPSASAPDRIRLIAKPTGEGKFENDRMAATYFRVAMGFGASDGELRWAKLVDSDILGGAAAKGGFAFCTAKGDVLLVDSASGAKAGVLNLGAPVMSCEVQAGDFTVPSNSPESTLAEQLGEVIATKDPQMVPAQRFLLTKLGGMQDDSVTKVLIDLASNTDTPPALYEDSRKLLAERRSGADFMLKALEREYDFLDDVLLPPPVGPLADALAAMKEQRAAGPLAHHLNDPSDTPDDIKRAAKALETLASAEQFSDLKIFFALYRATASDDDIIAAVVSVAKAMLRVGGKEGETLVAEAAKDPLTNSEVQEALQGLKPAAAEKKPEEPAKKTASK